MSIPPYLPKVTMVANNITLKKKIHQRLKVIKTQQQQ